LLLGLHRAFAGRTAHAFSFAVGPLVPLVELTLMILHKLVFFCHTIKDRDRHDTEGYKGEGYLPRMVEGESRAAELIVLQAP
jgi:hypothetical protein